MRIMLALRLFLRALFDAAKARQLAEVLQAGPGPASPAVEARPAATAARPAAPAPKPQSEALTLLAALQREARLVDIVREPLGDYSDAQIGAAAREVLRDCGAVLQRFFDLQPLVAQPEGSSLEVPADYDPLRFRLSGNVSDHGPYRGQLVHHGWVATRCELPVWSGKPESALVVAPVLVELP